MTTTADYTQIVNACLASDLEVIKAREVAERAVGIPKRCEYRGVEGDRCTRILNHGDHHEWGTDEYKSVLRVK